MAEWRKLGINPEEGKNGLWKLEDGDKSKGKKDDESRGREEHHLQCEYKGGLVDP
jgi:hypothetical protein